MADIEEIVAFLKANPDKIPAVRGIVAQEVEEPRFPRGVAKLKDVPAKVQKQALASALGIELSALINQP
eukprot:12309461-Alexandrium_andersonii.AAC.1